MRKNDTVTFKVDPNLLEILQAMPNRSEFIRCAIHDALNHGCPLCNGAGVLSPSQKKCWNKFAEKHEIRRCSKTDELLFVCNVEATES